MATLKHPSAGITSITLTVAILLSGGQCLAASTLAGCEYWENHSIADLGARLGRARNDYFSIPEPTQSDLDQQYQITWKYYEESGQDPAYQMQFADAQWLTRLYMARKYKESIGFVPSQQEVWVYCLDTRQGSDACKVIARASGALAFDASGKAVDPPPSFLIYYDKSRENFFEHTMLAAMIVDALPACDESDEAEKLADKAFEYIREFQSGRRP